MARDGIPIVMVSLVLALAALGLFLPTRYPVWGGLFGVLALFTLFSAYFFRDPERTVPTGAGLVVSPADGKVIEIVEEENSYMGGRARRISIFLNVFNVHINRMPCAGTVAVVRYYPGKFLAAWDDKASLDNEQTHVGMDCGGHKILVKQIAGLIARRIVCRAKEGASYQRGERFGMIKFGSRTDLFLPLAAEVKVKVGDKVAGAATIIAVMP
jgi:phosphatidylserine decarboxylase